MPYQQNSTKICLLGYQEILQKYAYWDHFACRIHICNENSSKSYDFHEKLKKKKKKNDMNNFGNFC